MSHMVIFQTPDGNPGYNQFESLEEAVRFVEQLRNDQGVSTARMFALEEVKFDFKPYFKVELDPPMVTSGAGAETSPPVDVPPAFGEAVAGFVAPEQPRSQEPPYFAEPSHGAEAPAEPSHEPVYGQEPAYGQEPTFASPAGEGEPAGVGAPPPPTFMAVPPNEEEAEQPTRRGLFGR